MRPMPSGRKSYKSSSSSSDANRNTANDGPCHAQITVNGGHLHPFVS